MDAVLLLAEMRSMSDSWPGIIRCMVLPGLNAALILDSDQGGIVWV